MVNEVLVIDPHTRAITVPQSELVFGVESDLQSESKYFRCPRYVGNNLDLASCFIRVNFRNANGEIDGYLVEDVSATEEYITFSWVLSSKVTAYKGQIAFVVCAYRPTNSNRITTEWNTTVAMATVLEGLEPDTSTVEAETSDVVAQLIAMVEEQTELVRTEGASQVTNIRAVTTTSIEAVETAAETAQSDAVTEIEAKGVNTLASIPDDYTALSGVVDTLTRSTAPAIVCEAAGTAVAVTDASDMPIQGLRVFGKSTQDGVPTPEAPVEIVSVEKPVVTVCGKNLCGAKATSSFNAGGVIVKTIDGSAELVFNGTAVSAASVGFINGIFLSKGRYTVSVFGLNTINHECDRIYLRRESDNKILVNNVMDGVPKSFLVEEDATVTAALVFGATTTYENETVKIQIEKGDTFTGYEAYTTQTVETNPVLFGIPVTSGGNYIDGSGQQWICDEVDLERGVYVQRVNTLILKTGSSVTLANGNVGLVVGFPNKAYTINNGLVCTHAVFDLKRSLEVGTCYENQQNAVICGSPDDTVESLLEKYRGSTFLYALSSPIETPLSESEIATYRELHSNHPNTTVLNDSGAHMVVKYAADTKRYIDNKIKEVLA